MAQASHGQGGAISTAWHPRAWAAQVRPAIEVAASLIPWRGACPGEAIPWVRGGQANLRVEPEGKEFTFWWTPELCTVLSYAPGVWECGGRWG